MELCEGQIIDGLFRITKPGFAQGAAGEIHLALDSSNRAIALKFLRADSGIGNVEKFKGEYQTLLKFCHPNVARAFHFGRHEGRFFIASEFVEGEEFQKGVRGVRPSQVIPLFIQALEGLEAIHNLCMLHLDLKSSNVLVTEEGQVKIIDFGFSSALEKLPPASIRGAIPYMAPEMVRTRPVDNRADLFSLGVLFYYSVTGKYPFPARNRALGDFAKMRAIVEKENPPPKPSGQNKNIPAYLDDILLCLLAGDPDERFGTARAVINALKTRHPEDYKETPASRGAYLIPEGRAHIGRVREQQRIFSALDQLEKGRQPQDSVFQIEGGEGTGKSHLLRKIKERAEQKAEKISIHFLELPRHPQEFPDGDEWPAEWTALLNRRLAENERPILVLVDNARSLSPVLENLVERAAERKRNPVPFQNQRPVLVCLSSEKCESDLPAAVRIRLKAFSEGEISSYLLATPALRHKKPPKAWIEELYHQTGGNPRSLARRLELQDSRGLLFDLNGDIHVARLEDDSLEFAASQAFMPNVVGELTVHERGILEWLALWTRRDFLKTAPLADLQELTGKAHLLPCLNHLASRGLVERDRKTGGWFFPNFSPLPALIYQSLDPAARESRHQKIHDILPEGEARLFHRAMGCRNTGALRAILRLFRRFLFEEGRTAVPKELLERGLEISAPGNAKLRDFLLGLLARACFSGSEYAKAKAFCEEGLHALKQFKNPPRVLTAELVTSLLPALLETRQFEEAQKVIDATLKRFNGFPHSHYAPVLLNFRGRIFYKKYFLSKKNGKAFLVKAREVYEQSELLEKDLKPVRRNLIRNNDLGIILQALGNHRSAVKKMEARLKRLRANPGVFIELNTLFCLAEAHRFLKNYPKAFRRAREAVQLARKTGQGKWIVYAHHILAGIHQHLALDRLQAGRKSLARRQYARALKENVCCLAASTCLEDKKEAGLYAVGTFLRAGQCCLELERPEEALEYFRAAQNHDPPEIYQSQISLGLGEYYLRKKDFARAAKSLNRCAAVTKKLPSHLAKLSEAQIRKARADLRRLLTQQGR